MVIRHIGIDFGTSSTVMKIKDYNSKDKNSLDSQTVSVLIDGEVTIPSTVFVINDDFEEPDHFIFGKNANICQQEGKLYRNFKMDLVSEELECRQKAEKLILAYFKWLKINYTEQKIDYFHKCDEEVTIISYPLKWSKSLKSYMIEVAKKAGFVNVKGMDEASAAIKYLLFSKLHVLKDFHKVMLLDMGAGTTDILIGDFDVKNKKFSIVSSFPCEQDSIYYGGNEFDERIFDLIDQYLRDCGVSHDNEYYRQELLIACQQWKEKVLSPCLQNKQTIAKIPNFVNFMTQNVRLNEKLFPIFDRVLFESLFSININRFADIIEQSIEASIQLNNGIDSKDDIELVVLTGGHSKWYFISDLLTGRSLSPDGRNIMIPQLRDYPNQLLQLSHPNETVALGLVHSDIAKSENKNFHSNVVISPLQASEIMALNYVEKECMKTPLKQPLTIRMEMEGENSMQNIDYTNLNLLVAGPTGAGKTTLVNCMFSKSVGTAAVGGSQTQGINKYTIPSFPITVYDVQGFDFENTGDIIKNIHSKITEEQMTLQEERLIHAILYCVSGVQVRFTHSEETFIKQLASTYRVPIFIVMTQAYDYFEESYSKSKEHMNYVKSRNLSVNGYFPVVCEKYLGIEPFGIEELMDKLWEELPKQLADILAGARTRQLAIKHSQAVHWIWGYAVANFALGAVIPAGADVVYLMSIESVMALHITSILYKGGNMELQDIISEVIAICAGPILAAVGGTLVFNELMKVGSYLLAPVTLGGSLALSAFTGGLVAAGITIGMGLTYLWIAEGLLTGKIDKEKIKQKDPAFMKMIQAQMKINYENARTQMKQDKRFSKDNFYSKKS